jgi:hypothetical protein
MNEIVTKTIRLHLAQAEMKVALIRRQMRAEFLSTNRSRILRSKRDQLLLEIQAWESVLRVAEVKS